MDRTLATFHVQENGDFLIEFSGSALEICLSSLSLIEQFSQFIQETDDNDQETKEVFQDVINTQASELSELLQVIGHEMYHARQASQHHVYYLRTLASNKISRMIREGFLNKDDAKQHLKKDLYTGDRGEKAAEAFGIRYVREKIKVIGLKKNKSALEQIILLGQKRTIADKTAELSQRVKQTSWE